MDSEFLAELWSRVKPLIPAKDRLDAADGMISVFDEYGYTEGFETATEFDKEIKAAIVSKYGLDAEEEDEYN